MLDRSIWKNIGAKKFCSFKKITETDTLCKHLNNLTGLCNEFSCPLANTKYATIRAVDEELFIFIKEPERIHTPKDQYEKIKLSKNYNEAIQQIEKELKYWDSQIIHKCKQKLTKLTEYLERLEYFKEHGRTEYMVRKKKMNRKEKLAALMTLQDLDFEKQIGDELLMRLETGIYGEELKDRYYKASEKFKEEEKNKNVKKRYVAVFEESDSSEKDIKQIDEDKEMEENKDDTKRKAKKTKKETYKW